MKRAIFSAFFLFLLAACGFSSYVPDRIIIKFKPGVVSLPVGSFAADSSSIKAASVNSLNTKYNVIKIEKAAPFAVSPTVKIKTLYSGKSIAVPDLTLLYKVTFPKGSDIEKIIPEYAGDPNIEYAHPDHMVKAFNVPDDPGYAQYQWDLKTMGCPAAWDITTGEANSISAAVIDTGVDYNHEELAGKVILGRNYVNTATPNNPLDDNGHGTHIAGVIAAIANNLKGIAGINWNAKIYAVKVLDYDGYGTTSDTVAGMADAADAGVKVINLSLGDSNYSKSFDDAVNYCYSKGSLVVAAAGNENTSQLTYPAALPNAMAVAATDPSDVRSVWNTVASSNYGWWVDISAPGSRIYSTWLSNGYMFKDGTSMATPHVAGLATLLLSRNPNWTPDQLRSRIEATADNIDAMNPTFIGLLGKGRINAAKAIGIPKAQITSPASGSYVSGIVPIIGYADSIDLDYYSLYVGAGAAPVLYNRFFTGYSQKINQLLCDFDSRTVSDGSKTIKLSAVNHEPYTTEATAGIIADNTKPKTSIISPSQSQTVEGTISIIGTASDANFDYFLLEYSKDGSNFIKIISSNTSITNGEIATWNTQGLSGKYFIRLTAADKALNTNQATIEVEMVPTGAGSVYVSGISKLSPNPFNPAVQRTTNFSYNLNQNSDITILLYNLSGELIWQKSYTAGAEGGKSGLNLAPWDGSNANGELLENGVYVYKITTTMNGGKKILDNGKVIILRS